MINEVCTRADLDAMKNSIINEVRMILRNEPPRGIEAQWLKGREVKKIYSFSQSKLKRLRLGGQLRSKKIGGTYYYLIEYL